MISLRILASVYVPNTHTHTHTHLCNPPSGLVGNSHYSVFVNTEEKDLKRISAQPMAYLLPGFSQKELKSLASHK